MRKKGLKFWLLIAGLALFPAGIAAQEAAQSEYARRFQNGSQLYNLQRWNEAAIEFRRAEETAASANERSAALYWVILSQLAHTDYGSALLDMDELQRSSSNSTYARDMNYHRARIYFNQGYFEDALSFFNNYIRLTNDSDRETADRRAAAYFWMGECLYAMGQFDDAEKFYAWVVGRYPESPKIEAATYRIDLIKQKKIEAELLALLQWSHEESLRTSEDFQRTIRTYEHTLNVYQRRIAELTNSMNSLNLNENRSEEPSGPVSRNNNIRQPVENIPAPLYLPQTQNDDLLERARELGNNVQELIRELEARGEL